MSIDSTQTSSAAAQAVTQLTSTLSRQIAEVFNGVQARADRERQEAVAYAVEAETDARRREVEAQRRALDAQLKALRSDYDDRLAEQLATSRDEQVAREARLRAEFEAAVADATRETDARIAELTARESELLAARDTDVSQVRSEMAAALAAAESAADLRLAEATSRVAALEAAHESQRLQLRASLDSTSAVGIAEREQALASGARLLSAVERLDAATTLRETLDALADGVVAEVARAPGLRGPLRRPQGMARRRGFRRSGRRVAHPRAPR